MTKLGYREPRRRVFEKGVQRRIFGTGRQEVIEGWKKLQTEFRNLYSSPNTIRVIKLGRMRWVEHIACTGKIRNAFKILVGKPEVETPLGRLKPRWEDNIKTDLKNSVS
jgi:hypothetical protein